MLLSLGSTMTREGLTTDLFRLKSEPLHRPAPSRRPRYESTALDMGSWDGMLGDSLGCIPPSVKVLLLDIITMNTLVT